MCGCRGSSGDKRPSEIAHDFSTPEGAVLCLEDAYRAKDIEKALSCKAFLVEAATMLERSIEDLKDSSERDMIAKSARVLEDSFRRELETRGFPDLPGIHSTFGPPGLVRNNVVIVTEVRQFPDGSSTSLRYSVAKTEDGWRVVRKLD
jgi:hypothetical protein